MSSLSAKIHHYSVVCNGHFFSIEPQKRRAISISFDFLTEKKYSPFGKKTGDYGLLKKNLIQKEPNEQYFELWFNSKKKVKRANIHLRISRFE